MNGSVIQRRVSFLSNLPLSSWTTLFPAISSSPVAKAESKSVCPSSTKWSPLSRSPQTFQQGLVTPELSKVPSSLLKVNCFSSLSDLILVSFRPPTRCHMLTGFFLAIFSPMWGALADRIGCRPLLISGLAAFTIACVGIGCSTHLWMAVLARCIC